MSPQAPAALRRNRSLLKDLRGQVTLEYALILAAVGLPLLWVFRRCVEIVTEHYAMMTFLNSLPFP